MNTKEIFMETYQKYIHRPGAASLLNWLLSTDFFEAPDSTKYHGNYAGGLALHSLNVFERMSHNCVYEHGKDCGGCEPFPAEWMEPIAVVALLHDICKAEFYEMCPLALQLHIADLQATYLDESAQALGKGV